MVHVAIAIVTDNSNVPSFVCSISTGKHGRTNGMRIGESTHVCFVWWPSSLRAARRKTEKGGRMLLALLLLMDGLKGVAGCGGTGVGRNYWPINAIRLEHRRTDCRVNSRSCCARLLRSRKHSTEQREEAFAGELWFHFSCAKAGTGCWVFQAHRSFAEPHLSFFVSLIRLPLLVQTCVTSEAALLSFFALVVTPGPSYPLVTDPGMYGGYLIAPYLQRRSCRSLSS